MNIYNLEKCFEGAIEAGAHFVAIAVSCTDMIEDEIVINPIENAEKKLAYYKKAYNEDLTLKVAPNTIRIKSFTYGATLAEIEEDLL